MENLWKICEPKTVLGLIGTCLNDYHLDSEADLMKIGKQNLAALVVRCGEELQATEGMLKKTLGTLEFLDGKGAQDIQPHFGQCQGSMQFVVASELYGDMIARPHGYVKPHKDSTTFSICGWCKYASAVRKHGNCKILSWCDLVCAEAEPNQACTFCKLMKMTPEQREKNLRDFVMQQEKLCARKQLLEDAVQLLSNLIATAEMKPLFPSLRRDDAFDCGEPLVCFCPDATTILQERRGVFTTGYALTSVIGDCVLVQMSEPVRAIQDVLMADATMNSIVKISVVPMDVSPDYADLADNYVGFPSKTALIMSDEDFEFLKSRPDYRELWLQQGSLDRRHELLMLAAFKETSYS